MRPAFLTKSTDCPPKKKLTGYDRFRFLKCAASLIASKSMIGQVASLLVPRSVNGFAQDFFAAAINDRDHFKAMWETTPVYRAEMIRMLKELGVKPKDGLPMWVPFIYADMLSARSPQTLTMAFEAGFPIRSCESFGKPQFVRLAVRQVQSVQEPIAALRASEELMAVIAAEQQNYPSVIVCCDGVPVWAELACLSTFGSGQITATVRHNPGV
jgi:hypothetical protein